MIVSHGSNLYSLSKCMPSMIAFIKCKNPFCFRRKLKKIKYLKRNQKNKATIFMFKFSLIGENLI